MSRLPLHECAVRVHPADEVAVVKRLLEAGDRVVLEDGREVEVRGAVPPGHRFALVDLPAGRLVRQYGQPIGTSRGLRAGEPLTRANLADQVPVVREVPEDLENPPPDYVPERQRARFLGFRRPDGRVGTRNWVVVIPTSMCASHEAQQIALRAEMSGLWSRERYPNVDGVVALPHNKGCGCNDGSNLETLLRTLANYAAHPNTGAVLFLDLGCEKTNLNLMDAWLKHHGGLGWDKPVHWIGIQEAGGTVAAVQQGLEAVEAMLPEAGRARRSLVPASELVLGVKCGGSDGFSGISANPALGHAADLVVRQGGTVLITEVPEFCGAEHLLAARARDAETARRVYAMVDWYKDYAARWGTVLGENPSPGNQEGGLLNITIKSLGAIAKAGTTRVEGVTGYGEPPRGRGLHLMQGPGYDQESTPGLVAAGANIVVFTTGRGTTIGNAITPVVKLSSNTPTFERMRDDIDLNAGGILDGTATIPEVGEEVFRHVLEVTSGRVRARAEENQHREFQVWAEQAISL